MVSGAFHQKNCFGLFLSTHFLFYKEFLNLNLAFAVTMKNCGCCKLREGGPSPLHAMSHAMLPAQRVGAGSIA